MDFIQLMRPVDWKEMKLVCESFGCEYDRTKGDHYIMTKPGLARSVRRQNLGNH